MLSVDDARSFDTDDRNVPADTLAVCFYENAFQAAECKH